MIEAANLGDRLIRTVVTNAALVINPEQFSRKVNRGLRTVFITTHEGWIEIWIETKGFTGEEAEAINDFLVKEGIKPAVESGPKLTWMWKKKG